MRAESLLLFRIGIDILVTVIDQQILLDVVQWRHEQALGLRTQRNAML